MTQQQPREFSGIDEYIKKCSTDPAVRATSKVTESDWSSFIGLCIADLLFDEEDDGSYYTPPEDE